MKVRKIHKGAGMRYRATDSQVQAGVQYIQRWLNSLANGVFTS